VGPTSRPPPHTAAPPPPPPPINAAAPTQPLRVGHSDSMFRLRYIKTLREAGKWALRRGASKKPPPPCMRPLPTRRESLISSTPRFLRAAGALLLVAALFLCVCKEYGQQTSPMQSASRTSSMQSAAELNAVGFAGHGQQTTAMQSVSPARTKAPTKALTPSNNTHKKRSFV
jgi:hypothetical protein